MVEATLCPQLPPEVLSHIFLHVDPHTLYTSVRALSRSWKACVEEHLLAHEFNTGRWRLGLRVVKRARRGQPWRGGVVGGEGLQAPGGLWSAYKEAHAGARSATTRRSIPPRPTQGLSASMLFALGSPDEEDNEAQTNGAGADTGATDDAAAAKVNDGEEAALRQRFASANVLSRRDALEDELPRGEEGADSDPLIHILPLQFSRYDAENVSLQFTTGLDEWHALFEQQTAGEADASEDEEDTEGRREAEESRRLDLDFGLVWRFPGDGQDDDPEVGTQGWGRPDPENGWLSRFYCSGYDMKPASAIEQKEEGEENEREDVDRLLQSTPLARRRRTATLRRESPSDYEGQEELFWSDDGHEYMSLSLSLGAEFFVRRAARTNHLLRRLEVAARSQEDKRAAKRGRRNRFLGANSNSSTASSTPMRASSPPPPPSRATAVATAREGNSPCLTPKTKSATSSPPRRLQPGPLPKASWAAIAATPPRSGTSSPVPQGRPRVAQLVPHIQDKKVKAATHEEVNDGEEAEEASAASEDHDALQSIVDSVSTTSGQATAVATTQGSNRRSSPRATFVCKLMRPSAPAQGSQCWTGGDAWGRSASRLAPASRQLEKVATWEWRR